MISTFLTPCPKQTQIHHVYRAFPFSVMIHFTRRPYGFLPGPNDQFLVIAGGFAEHPDAIALCGNRLLQLYNVNWLLRPPTYVYYYGPPPPLYLEDLATFLPWHWTVPWFQYRYPRPLMPRLFTPDTTFVNVHLDRPFAIGDADPANWLFRIGANDYHPTAIYGSGDLINLAHIQFLWHNPDWIQYTPGTPGFVAANGGVMPAWKLNWPFPVYA